MKECSTPTRSPEWQPYHQMLLSILPRKPLFVVGVLSICGGYSHHILSPIGRAGFYLELDLVINSNLFFIVTTSLMMVSLYHEKVVKIVHLLRRHSVYFFFFSP